jgi:glucose/arabinose dehydrogenase
MAERALFAVAALCGIRSVLGVPDGFIVKEMKLSNVWSPPMEMLWIDEARALVLMRNGDIDIVNTDENGLPRQEYMSLDGVYMEDETGALAMALDPEWHRGQKFIYVYWGSQKGNGHKAGMRISRFEHHENGGWLKSRGRFGSQRVLWYDTDGWGSDPQWHYGGSMSFGPSGHLFLTLGELTHYSVWC